MYIYAHGRIWCLGGIRYRISVISGPCHMYIYLYIYTYIHIYIYLYIYTLMAEFGVLEGSVIEFPQFQALAKVDSYIGLLTAGASVCLVAVLETLIR